MGRERGTGKSTTLAEVAKLAGVAPMTVSRYLNKHPNISQRTANKVAAAIECIGYTPNLAARILMGRPSNTIGLVVPTLSDSFFSEMAHSVQATASAEGKLVWVASSGSNPKVEASLLEQMRQHHVDGILLVPTAGTLESRSITGKVPLVVLDRPLEDGCDAVLVDNRGGMSQLVEHFISHGFTRVLCLSTDAPTVYTVGERIRGYRDVVRKNKLKAYSRAALFDRVGVKNSVRLALSGPGKPQAIVCTNNLTTIYVLEALFEGGLHIPNDVAVGGFDDFELASLLRPGITVVKQSAADLGTRAAHLLLERLSSPDDKWRSVTTILPVSLVLRGSCGCRSETIAST